MELNQLLEALLIIVIFLIIILIVILKYQKEKISKLNSELEQLKFSKKSGEVKHGKNWEQFVPFMNNFPYNKDNFRFIGTPIDGIVFEDNKIIFVEIKTGESKLSSKQKNVKKIIENKDVEFVEFRY
jgi:predicted Holliday junction resolvase-like endonuclease